ncbi:MAG: dihydrolipoamide acetyltransferase family protein [Paludibacteraceae bacterium]
MAQIVIMPKQGQSVESCIITEIRKKKGDKVKKGEVLFAYETDKASFEEESLVDGTILGVFYNEGDEVPVLDNMMIIGAPNEDYSTLLGHSQETTINNQGSEVNGSESEPQNSDIQARNVESENRNPEQTTKFISPRAKNLASQEALDTKQISGTGPKGRIIEKDIQSILEIRPKLTPLAKKIAAKEGLQPDEAGSGLAGKARSIDLIPPVNTIYGVEYEDRKISNMRKIIARSMHDSLQNSAQLTHHLGADARRILELRKYVKAEMEKGTLSINITLNDMVCFAVIKALRKFPNVNTHFMGDSIRYFDKVHLALAVDTERGLMVPVVRNADDLSIAGLASQFKELAAACRKGNINPELLSSEAATFTVSNLGNYGVEIFTPVINLPQSAILGVNTIVPRPKDLGDGVYAFVPFIGLSLTYDHRALDGGEATRFLKQIAVEIENLEIDF